jgi:CIC family chloride channel protein
MAAATSADPSPRLRFTHAHYHYVRAALVGVLVGVLAIAFQWSIALVEHWRGTFLERLHALPHASYWAWSILPAIALVVCCAVGQLVAKAAPEAAGSGIHQIKGVLLHIRTLRPKRIIPVKFAGGVLSIGTGLSLGREGPTVQMGAAIASAVGTILKVPARTFPQLVSCGAGAGLAAAFNAPLAGFLFVIEELHREMSSLTFGGALIAAVTADIVSRAFTGQLPSFSVQGYPALPLHALPAVAVLGITGGAFGALFTRSILKSQRLLTQAARQARVPLWMLPGLCAAAVALLAWWIPDAAGGGHAVADQLLQKKLAPSMTFLLILLVAKFATTIVSYASGAPGGIFAPMLLMGTVMGIIAARITGLVEPSLAGRVDAFAVIGMAAIFTGTVRAPLTGIILIVEMTSNYEQMLSLCVACFAANLTSEFLRSTPIYEALLEDDIRRRGLAAPGAQPEGFEPRTVVMGIQRESALAGKSIRDGSLPQGCLVVGVERGGKELLPHADFVLAPGDHITVLTPANQPEAALAVVDLARAQ